MLGLFRMFRSAFALVLFVGLTIPALQPATAQEPGTPEPETFDTADTGTGSLRLVGIDDFGNPLDGVCFSINDDSGLAPCTGSQGVPGESLVEGLAAGTHTVTALPPIDYIASEPQTVEVIDGGTAIASFTLTYIMPMQTAEIDPLVLEVEAPAGLPSVTAGDTVAFTITVVNTSETDLTGLVVIPYLTASFNQPFPITLAPGDSATRVAIYAVSFADAAAGQVMFAVTASADPSHSVTAMATLPVTSAPEPDTTGPSVAFDSLQDGDTLAGIVSIAALTDDPSGVAEVRFKYSATPDDPDSWVTLPDSDGSDGWWVNLDTTMLASGLYSLRAVAEDTLGNTSTTQISVTIDNPVIAPLQSEPPVANQDDVTTGAGQPVTIYPLANDTDADTPQEELTFTLIPADGPSHGTTSLDSGDPTAVIYTPNPGFFGNDGFYYELSDGVNTAIGWVRIEIKGTLRLDVTILDPENLPVPWGCFDLYTVTEDDQPDQGIAAECGDITGITRFSGLGAGRYLLRDLATPFGFESLADQLIDVGPDAVTDISITRQLAGGYGTLSITASGAAGALNGACWELRIPESETPEPAHVACDSEDGAMDGRTRIYQIEPGSYTLHQSRTPSGNAAPADQTVTFVAGQLVTLDVPHLTGDALRISTVHEDGSTIVGRCATIVDGAGNSVASSCDNAFLDGASDGIILMPVLPPGNYSATVNAFSSLEDYLPITTYTFTVMADGTVVTENGGNTLVVTFRRGGELLAHFVDGSGQPLTVNTCFALYHANGDGSRGANVAGAGQGACPGLIQLPDESYVLADLTVFGLAPGNYLLGISSWTIGFMMTDVPFTVTAGAVTEITATVTATAEGGSAVAFDAAAYDANFWPITTATLGQTIHVTFAVTNSGATPLTAVSLESGQFGILVSNASYEPDLGTQWFEQSYTITTADAARGYVAFTATLTTNELAPIDVTVTVHLIATPNTPADPDEPVTAAGGTGATLTFSDVSEAGFSAVTAMDEDQAPALPGGFSIDDALFFEINTTAAFDGKVLVCIPYDPETIPNARLLHYSGGAWVDITSADDSSDGLVCGYTDHFSPFAIAGLADADPPVITTPGPIVVEATSPQGATVLFTVTATDASGPVSVSCDRASGGTFPIGTTTVTCAAESAAGNAGSASFTVTVQATRTPTDKNQCKNGGWTSFNNPFFANQGSCVSFVMKKHT